MRKIGEQTIVTVSLDPLVAGSTQEAAQKVVDRFKKLGIDIAADNVTCDGRASRLVVE